MVGNNTPSNDERPIFVVVAERIANDIVAGNYAVGEQVPSQVDLGAFYRINPATAGKALARLADDGVLERRRGLGMFVAEGAAQRIRSERRAAFEDRFVVPLVAEARALGIDRAELTAMLDRHDGAELARLVDERRLEGADS